MKKINLDIEWAKNWASAYNFFMTTGNVKNKARLKKQWHDSFVKSLKNIEKIINQKRRLEHDEKVKLL